MEDRNCELLFEYLRSILYDSEVKPLEIDSLDEPFQKLGMGLQYLETAVKEMKQGGYGFHIIWKNIDQLFTPENVKWIQQQLLNPSPK